MTLNLISNSTIGTATFDLAIRQGKTYQLTFNYPSDLTQGEIRGEIRDKYLQDNGNLLATFSFNVTYDEVEEKSLIVATISATDTANIVYTKYQGNGDPSPRNCYVYDIEYEENEVVNLLLNGLVEVKPEVTD